MLNQTNFDLTLPVEQSVQAKLAVKDEYTFDFAELSPEYFEHEFLLFHGRKNILDIMMREYFTDLFGDSNIERGVL